MAAAVTDFHPQRLVSGTSSTTYPQNRPNPTRFYLHFIYKAVSVALVLVLIPLFPSQAPEFINQTILTRGWELFHLLFVGIAVSYGLFSRRNVETEKENHHQQHHFIKSDSTTQTYVSRILQVSSVFDDSVVEEESPSAVDDDVNNKVQTWNSQYFGGQSDVVVARENSIFGEYRNASSYARYNKPLFLPVRSLRSPVSDHESVGSVSETGRSRGSLSRSASDSRIGSSNSSRVSSSNNSSDRSGRREIGDFGPFNLEEKLEENVVLPSPIPWRSRSGRMEMREEMVASTPPLCSPSPIAKEPDLDQFKFSSCHSPILRSSQPNSTSPSPKNLSPSHSLSAELPSKNVEESGKKTINYKRLPTLSVPLPKPESPKSPTFESHSNSAVSESSSEKKHMKNDLNKETRELSRRRQEELRTRRNLRLDSLKTELKPRTHVEGPSIGKSVRTFRASESVSRANNSWEIDDQMDGKTQGMSNEDDATYMEETKTKKGGYDPFHLNHEKQNCEISSGQQNSEIVHSKSKKPKSSHQMKELARKVILESEEYSSSENESEIESEFESENENVNKNVQQSFGSEGIVSESEAGEHPSEVDKKADEFIAKFREQIRLQRIDSIKRSSKHRTIINSSR